MAAPLSVSAADAGDRTLLATDVAASDATALIIVMGAVALVGMLGAAVISKKRGAETLCFSGNAARLDAAL